MCRTTPSTPRLVQGSFPAKIDNFHIAEGEEPHIVRRKQILAKYPEIEQLFGYDNGPIPYVIAAVMAQLAIASYASSMSWPVFILTSWIIGGAFGHSLALMTHELSHNLVFKTLDYNYYFAIFCNVAMGIPSATTFKKYHMEHHQFQGDTVRDVDIPSHFEAWIFRGLLGKLLFVMSQSFLYSLRPMLVRPKSMNMKDLLNYVVIVGTDFLIYRFWGIAAVGYLVLSQLLGMSLHPIAGHLIAEHFVFDEGVETYSYYGSLNLIAWNVGYHNEHHDFPRVPGWRLPLVKKMAPEFYDNLPTHKSWSYVLWRFITDPNITCYSRTIRTKKKV